MSKTRPNPGLTRRGFLRGASLFGLGGAVSAFSSRVAGAAAAKTAPAAIPPQSYDVDRLRKTDPQLIHYEPAGSVPSPLKEPKRIVLGPAEQWYIAAGKCISVLDRAGVPGLALALSQEVFCLAVAKDGTLYAGLRDHIEVFNPKGTRVAKWNPPAGKAWLTSLAVGENDVFAADAGNRLVWRYDRSGKLVKRLGEKNAALGAPGFVVPSPYFDLEIGSEGLLWVANPGRYQVEAYTFEGRLERGWGEASFGIAGFCGCCNPAFFTRLPDGRFVTSEKGLARVKVYSADGKFESVVAGSESFPKYFENINAMPVAMDVAVDGAGRVLVADTLGHEIRMFKHKAA